MLLLSVASACQNVFYQEKRKINDDICLYISIRDDLHPKPNIQWACEHQRSEEWCKSSSTDDFSFFLLVLMDFFVFTLQEHSQPEDQYKEKEKGCSYFQQ